MSDVVRFVPKAELERDRLIREARAHYERVFPPVIGPPNRRTPENADPLRRLCRGWTMAE